MKNAHLKDTLREVWKTKSRFIAIFSIIALGTGFFSGVKATAPDMKLTADQYFVDNNLMDIRIVSSYGLNQEDISAIKSEKNIKELMPSFTIDAIAKHNSIDAVAKIHSIPLDLKDTQNGAYINRVRIIEGRLPINDKECVAEYNNASGSLRIGDTVTFDTGIADKDISDYLKQNSFKVVGLIENPYYMTMEKGTSSIGNGSVSTYICLSDKVFKMDYYTEAFVTLKSTEGLSAYSDEYTQNINAQIKRFEEIAQGRQKARYDEVYTEAKEKLDKAKADLENGEKEQEEQLSKAADKLNEAKQQIEDGRKQLEKNKKELERKLASGQKAIKKAEQQLQQGEQQYSQQLKDFEQNKTFMTPEQLAMAQSALTVARQKLDQGKIELEKSKKEFNAGKTNGEQGIKNAENKLISSQSELDKGMLEYEKNKSESDKKLAEAREKISTGESDLAKIPQVKWYVLDRTSNPGYSSFEDDTQRVDNIAKIFPVFFFIVAAFVCLTTMTRMVEEQRTQIGTYKALGYGNMAIAAKFLIYAAVASVSGSLVGISIGLKVFPYVISNAYAMLYRLPAVISPFRWDYAILITIGGVVCSFTAVYFACYKELLEQPSQLMRPKSPKLGKRVLIERVPFIWKRLGFFSKVTVRNLLRYKKRFIMTMLGVAGCTALMLAGFGMKDCISAIVPLQYGEIFTYDAMIILDENESETELNSAKDLIKGDTSVSSILDVRAKEMEAGVKNDWYNINVIVPQDTMKFSEFITLRKAKGHEPIPLSKEGVVITQKLADMLDLDVGDSLELKDAESQQVSVKVTEIAENYAMNYMYILPDKYEELFGQKPVMNSTFVKFNDSYMGNESEFSKRLTDNKAILQVSFTNTIKKSFEDMVENLNSIVFVLILSSGALAFVVLYNLSNINITERMREIASIKVLGFYDLEVSQYVFRENIILTIINIVIGLLAGMVLNDFVMSTAETKIVMFGREIHWYSYILAALLTLVFAVLVNALMHFRLKKIDMIESLKSVE